jgi:6-hydroxy-3-succinoylpyridine 3-monooxygenase
MQPGGNGALRTRVYIDGYNLYYGCLKNSAYKWLDIRTLAEHILANTPLMRNGESATYRFVNPAVKYFTASILKAFANSDDSISCQAKYHNALIAHLGGEFEIIKGYYDARPARAYRWEHGKAAHDSEQIAIWKLEEKKSDVALALHAYSDAVRDEVDQLVVVTNDSDFEPAMRMIRSHSKAILGLVAPIRAKAGNVNRELEKHAHWVRRYILDDEFARSQLPTIVTRRDNALHKPLSWYPRPDLLTPIFEEAKRVRGSAGAARKWLNQPCSHLGNRIPIEMCEQDVTAQELREYMERYAQEFGLARIHSNRS